MKKKKYSVLGWNKWKMEFSMVSGQKTIAAIALSFNKKESNLFYVLRRRQKEMRKKNQQRNNKRKERKLNGPILGNSCNCKIF